jgi:hypothetical protein
MTSDLKTRFAAADGIGAPDLWGEARRRAEAPEAPPRASASPPGTARRVAIGALAFAVFAVAIAFAWDLVTPDPRPVPRPPAAVDLAAELPIGWSELPAPPEVRSGAATAWTGSELLVWGGYEYVGGNEDPDAGGFSFDAVGKRWRELPASPLDGRSDPAFAWTGRELLVWGGWDGGFRATPYFDDGAAFDPVTGSWRPLPPSPLAARSPFSVWTGEELIVWGSTDRFDRKRDGAAFDPSANTWRRIADAPTDVTDGSAVWSGGEMIVFGAALDGNNHADTPTAIGIAYDPSSDAWRELPPSDLSPQAMTASWLGDEMIAWDYDHASQAYDPVEDAWRHLQRVPLDFAECRPESVSTSTLVFGNYCGQTVVFQGAESVWHRTPIEDLEGEGCCRVLELETAGDVVLVPSHSYGMGLGPPDRRMFVYNPPRVDATAATAEVLEPAPFIPPSEFVEGEYRMPIVFPDGSRATLVFPGELGLEELAVQPDVSYLWRADPPPRFPVLFLHDPNASITQHVAGGEPVGTVTGGGVEIWKMSEELAEARRLPEGHWLRYRLPSWTVLVALERPDEADEVADNLTLHETESGFAVVDASGPIALSDESGEGEGPMLSVGSDLDPSIFLWIEACEDSSGELSGGYGSVCLADGRVFASIYGDRDFIPAVIHGLRVEDFQVA